MLSSSRSVLLLRGRRESVAALAAKQSHHLPASSPKSILAITCRLLAATSVPSWGAQPEWLLLLGRKQLPVVRAAPICNRPFARTTAARRVGLANNPPRRATNSQLEGFLLRAANLCLLAMRLSLSGGLQSNKLARSELERMEAAHSAGLLFVVAFCCCCCFEGEHI